MSILVVELAWFGIALLLFRLCRPRIAVLAASLGGWILLPVGSYPAGSSDPLFPYWIVGLALPSDMLVSKAWVAPVSALLGVLAFDREAMRGRRPGWVDAPVVLWCLWPLAAAGFADGPRPAAWLASLYLIGTWGVPWCLGRLYLGSAEARLLLIKALALSGLACLPFGLIEGLLGPSLYGTVFGTPHPFRHDGDVRYIGFRPIGFFEHGNQFGLWISLCALAGLWLAHSTPPSERRLWRGAAAVLMVMALAAQSIGALLLLAIGATALSVFGRISPRLLLAGAGVLLALGGVVYVSGVIPMERIARDTAIGRELVSVVRAAGRGSLTWRVAQDQKLLKTATAHPVAGTSHWDWWRAEGSRPWGLTLLVLGQYGAMGLLLVLTVLLLPTVAVAGSAGTASAWRPDGLGLLMATLLVLSVFDALLNAFIFFPALLVAGAVARDVPRDG